jgi:hypothetical protein
MEKRTPDPISVPAKDSHTDGSIEEEVTSPDHTLLEFQKQRSMPKVSLSDVTEVVEKKLIEIDHFGELADADHKHYGMLPAGTEEVIVETLKKQGSIKMEEPIQLDEEEKKE